MSDLFEHTILCRKCQARMKKGEVIRNGFRMRMLFCPNGHDKVVHPQDKEEYKKFRELRQKEFKVKMRIVGNSYAVSIPKEIVSFIHEKEKMMNDMVRLCFEDAKKLSLNFGEEDERN